MTDSPMSRMIRHFCRTVLARDVGVSDGELLGEFVERNGGDALAALITRHGPMVWGVCRRHWCQTRLQPQASWRLGRWPRG